MDGKDGRHWAWVAGLTALLLAFAGVGMRVLVVWMPLMQPAERQPAYSVADHADDTIRVVMIGDSWAGMHHEMGLDSMMGRQLAERTGRPVCFVAKGRGGAKSREVYELMFRSSLNPSQLRYSTQLLIASRPDYCVVMAGINDAAANLGTGYYCRNYRLIVDWLLECGIKPVVVEMPDVNIPRLYSNKPLRHKAGDWLRSVLTQCRMYDVRLYREAWADTVRSHPEWEGRVLYLPCAEWNKEEWKDARQLYLDDDIHLNRRGYQLLDACLATKVASDVARCQPRNRRPSAAE